MSELVNNYPTHGDEGQKPPDGVQWDGGDQYEAPYVDWLWSQQSKDRDYTNSRLRERTRDLHGNRVFGGGVVTGASTGSTDISVSAVSGGYVDGEKVGAVGSKTFSLSSNSTSSTRTDSVYLNREGQISTTQGSSPPTGSMVLAEVDVAPDNTVAEIRNTGVRHNDTGSVGTFPNDDSSTAGDTLYERPTKELGVYDGQLGYRHLLFADGRTGRRGDQDYGGHDLQNVHTVTDDDANTIYDGGDNHVPIDRLQHNDTTVSSGDYLTGGGQVELGQSATLNVDMSGVKTELDDRYVNEEDGSLTVGSGDYLTGGGLIDLGGGRTLAVDYASLRDDLDDDIGEAAGYTGGTYVGVDTGGYLRGGGRINFASTRTINLDYASLTDALDDRYAQSGIDTGYSGQTHVGVHSGSYLSGGGQIEFATSRTLGVNYSNLYDDLQDDFDSRYVNEDGDLMHDNLVMEGGHITLGHAGGGNSEPIYFDDNSGTPVGIRGSMTGDGTALQIGIGNNEPTPIEVHGPANLTENPLQNVSGIKFNTPDDSFTPEITPTLEGLEITTGLTVEGNIHPTGGVADAKWVSLIRGVGASNAPEGSIYTDDSGNLFYSHPLSGEKALHS